MSEDIYNLNFRRIHDLGTDPKWPQYTGESLWSNGHFRVREKRYGGILARTVYTLLGGEEDLGSWDSTTGGDLKKMILAGFEKHRELVAAGHGLEDGFSPNGSV